MVVRCLSVATFYVFSFLWPIFAFIMGLLDEFLCALSQTEREQITQLPLKGKEDLVLRALMPKGTDCVTQPPNFDIGIDHLNKIQSVLLRKCYAVISGNDDVKLIWFLNQRNLPKHMYREINRVEKELEVKQLADAELLPYYKEFFMSSVDVMAKYFDAEQSKHRMEHYLALVPEAEREQERCNANAKYSYPYLVSMGMKVITDAQKQELGQYLLGLLEDARRLNHLEATVLCLKNMVYYYNYTVPGLNLRYQYLSEMAHLVENSPEGFFSPMRHAITRADLAEFLLSANRWDEALQQYRDLFAQYAHEMLDKPYHCAHYAHTAMLCGDMDLAWHLLDLYFKRHITHYNAALSAMAASLYVKYYLLLPDLPLAKKYLQTLWDVNNKQTYMVYEVYYRALETAWLWASKDYATAYSVAGRHIKYLQSNKIKQNYDPICLVFPYTQALYQAKTTRKPLSPKHLAMQQQLNQSHFAVFGKVLV